MLLGVEKCYTNGVIIINPAFGLRDVSQIRGGLLADGSIWHYISGGFTGFEKAAFNPTCYKEGKCNEEHSVKKNKCHSREDGGKEM